MWLNTEYTDTCTYKWLYLLTWLYRIWRLLNNEYAIMILIATKAKHPDTLSWACQTARARQFKYLHNNHKITVNVMT